MKLRRIIKSWEPDITTVSWHGKGSSGVYISLSVGGGYVQSPFVSSHAAAAAWACEEIGKSLDQFALAFTTIAAPGPSGVEIGYGEEDR